jgi:nicotinamidase-related amidase
MIRLYRKNGSNVDLCRRKVIEDGLNFVVPDSNGAELVREIKPMNSPRLNGDLLLSGRFQSLGDYDWVMYTPRWGAFYQTQLEEFLVERGIYTLIFTGCNFPNCPRTSMYEASERDFKVVMTADTISGVYDQGIWELRNIGITVLNSDDIIRYLDY